jgi:hypothetical protein
MVRILLSKTQVPEAAQIHFSGIYNYYFGQWNSLHESLIERSYPGMNIFKTPYYAPGKFMHFAEPPASPPVADESARFGRSTQTKLLI